MKEARVFFPAYFINSDTKRAALLVLDFSSEGKPKVYSQKVDIEEGDSVSVQQIDIGSRSEELFSRAKFYLMINSELKSTIYEYTLIEGGEEKHLKLTGMREAWIPKKKTVKKEITLLPYIGPKNEEGEPTRGVQLMVQEFEKGNQLKENFTSCTILDPRVSEFNFTRQNQFLSFGYQKFFFKDGDQGDKFFVLTSACLNDDFVFNHYLDEFEAKAILEQTVSQQIRSVPFSFEKFIKHPIVFDMKKENYMNSHEALGGKSIYDLSINNLGVIEKIISTDFKQVIQRENLMT